MNIRQARNEARKRWGPMGSVGIQPKGTHFGDRRYHVGTVTPRFLMFTIEGMGTNWAEAFADAEFNKRKQEARYENS